MNLLGISNQRVAQLRAYLKDDPLDITEGIPDQMAEHCGRIVELYFAVCSELPDENHKPIARVFVCDIFQTALRMIFNTEISVDIRQIYGPGLVALFVACDEMELKERDDIENNLDEETRNNIPDWDGPMIACAVIKACGNAFLATLKEAEIPDDTPQTP